MEPIGVPGGSDGKASACNAGELDLILGLRRSPGEGKDYPFQYSGLENSRDCIVHGVAKSQLIKRNTFESVLMRWMKLDPVI